MFNINLATQRPNEVVLKRGETVIIAFWRWEWPPWNSGYKRKAVTLCDDGEIDIRLL